MNTFLIVVTKYLFILLMMFYTWQCFRALKCKSLIKASGIFQLQNGTIILTYILGIITIYLNQTETNPINVILLGGVQLCYLIVALGVFPIIYPTINRSILSNMCMLLTIGFIILARLDFKSSLRQFIIVSIVTLLSLIVPFFMSKFTMWKSLTWIYCFAGLGLLGFVLIAGAITNGAKLSMQISGFVFQPSEFVKIIFVFFISGLLAKSAQFMNVVVSAVFAGIYVIVLVLSTDLGSALIFFMMYIFMVYVASKRAIYLVIGMTGFSAAAIVAYNIFSHLQNRVLAWINPFDEAIINGVGNQVSQSLFALGNGGFTGTGLYQGYPYKIPVVKNDFIFSAIGEEFGAIFAILLILVCLSCFVSFLKTAMAQVSIFNRLVCVGLGVGYAVQVILTIGGAIKMIPSTGVTLPLVSNGGSSILSTLLVFAIIQGLAIVGTSNEKKLRRRPVMEEEEYDSKKNRKVRNTGKRKKYQSESEE